MTKQDYMDAIEHKKPRNIPFYGPPVLFKVAFMDTFEKGPAGGGMDGYGVRWEPVPAAAVPATDVYVLNDVTKWREQICFPDLDAIDWKAKYEKETQGVDRNKMHLEYGMGNGPFERILAWMGYQPLIDAILEEPEAVHEVIDAWVEHRLHFVDLVCKYYHPEFITIYDDVAFEKGLFLTKDMYQEFIKPAHKAVNDAIWAGGSIPINHCCGKAEELIDDFIEEGCQAWTSVQPVNDIESLLKKYHDKLTIIGGFNSNGRPALKEASEEERFDEIHRTIDSYAKYGSFIFGNMVYMGLQPDERASRTERAMAEIIRYGSDYYERNNLI